MSDDGRAFMIVMVFAVLMSAIVSAGITTSYDERHWQSEAIARGVAGYDEKTGEWKWTVERKVAE